MSSRISNSQIIPGPKKRELGGNTVCTTIVESNSGQDLTRPSTNSNLFKVRYSIRRKV